MLAVWRAFGVWLSQLNIAVGLGDFRDGSRFPHKTNVYLAYLSFQWVFLVKSQLHLSIDLLVYPGSNHQSLYFQPQNKIC
jgi:hypothetical protein